MWYSFLQSPAHSRERVHTRLGVSSTGFVRLCHTCVVVSWLQVEFGKVGFRTNRKLSKIVPDHLEGMPGIKVCRVYLVNQHVCAVTPHSLVLVHTRLLPLRAWLTGAALSQPGADCQAAAVQFAASVC